MTDNKPRTGSKCLALCTPKNQKMIINDEKYNNIRLYLLFNLYKKLKGNIASIAGPIDLP